MEKGELIGAAASNTVCMRYFLGIGNGDGGRVVELHQIPFCLNDATVVLCGVAVCRNWCNEFCAGLTWAV